MGDTDDTQTVGVVEFIDQTIRPVIDNETPICVNWERIYRAIDNGAIYKEKR